MFEIFANVLNNHQFYHKTSIFTAFAQYFDEAPLALFTASSLFVYDAPSLACLF